MNSTPAASARICRWITTAIAAASSARPAQAREVTARSDHADAQQRPTAAKTPAQSGTSSTVSNCPANDCSAPSSASADERTA